MLSDCRLRFHIRLNLCQDPAVFENPDDSNLQTLMNGEYPPVLLYSDDGKHTIKEDKKLAKILESWKPNHFAHINACVILRARYGSLTVHAADLVGMVSMITSVTMVDMPKSLLLEWHTVDEKGKLFVYCVPTPNNKDHPRHS
jgi:hypothetical protein